MPNKYLLASGYFHGPVPPAKNGCGRLDQRNFVEPWLENVKRHTPTLDHRPVVVAVGKSRFPDAPYTSFRVMQLEGDAGHVFQKHYPVSGGTGTILALAWLAYCDERDLLYREQDVLCFGPWVERMYQDLGPNGVVCCTRDRVMGYNGSLLLIRHSYIPEFTRLWLSFPPELSPATIAEMKLRVLCEADPARWRIASFGYDRERPFNTKDPVFFVHQPSDHDISILKAANLV